MWITLDNSNGKIYDKISGYFLKPQDTANYLGQSINSKEEACDIIR